MATRSSILAWRIPWTGEPGGLQFMGWQRVRHGQETKHSRVHMDRENGNFVGIYVNHEYM